MHSCSIFIYFKRLMHFFTYKLTGGRHSHHQTGGGEEVKRPAALPRVWGHCLQPARVYPLAPGPRPVCRTGQTLPVSVEGIYLKIYDAVGNKQTLRSCRCLVVMLFCLCCRVLGNLEKSLEVLTRLVREEVKDDLFQGVQDLVDCLIL